MEYRLSGGTSRPAPRASAAVARSYAGATHSHLFPAWLVDVPVLPTSSLLCPPCSCSSGSGCSVTRRMAGKCKR